MVVKLGLVEGGGDGDERTISGIC